MKIYVLEKGIIFSGKGWEIKQKLKESKHKYEYVSDWIADVHEQDKLIRKAEATCSATYGLERSV